MHSLRVSLRDRSYSILVGRDLLKKTGEFVKKLKLPERCALIVSQKEISRLYVETLSASFSREGIESRLFVVPQGKSSESAKSQVVYQKLLKIIVSLGGDHRSIFLTALGGGVIGDLTGFAASVYRRGIPYIQIPTTLTAQVDSAIGGKTAIDLPEAKNLIGTVYQPSLVISDAALLNSLPGRHWCDGFAEVIKYGVIKDAGLFYLLEKKGKEDILQHPNLLEKVVFRSSAIKAKLVEKDEFDKKGIRMVLNFGHTAGHAIEAASSYSRRYTHGEAVAIGMLIAVELSDHLGMLKDKALVQRLEKVLIKFGLPVFYKGPSPEAILKALGYDKKSNAGKNRFVLPVCLGRTVIQSDVPADAILGALERRKG